MLLWFGTAIAATLAFAPTDRRLQFETRQLCFGSGPRVEVAADADPGAGGSWPEDLKLTITASRQGEYAVTKSRWACGQDFVM